jgi:hypothetical protein
MKKIFIITFFIISKFIFSQNKAIVPTTGTIVFVKEENIFDKDLYIKSLKELMPKMKVKMKEEIFIERLTDGKKTDTLLLNLEVEKMAQNFEMMLPYIIEEPSQKIKVYHEFNQDTIKMYYSIDDEINKRIFINRISHEVKDENDEYVEFDKNEIIKLTEYKNENKLINGFNCFKIVYSFKTLGNSFDFMNLSSNNRELWVTEEIRCNYHPVINNTEILEKYYPLEIIEYSNDIKGTITTYKVETLKLK